MSARGGGETPDLAVDWLKEAPIESPQVEPFESAGEGVVCVRRATCSCRVGALWLGAGWPLPAWSRPAELGLAA